MIADDHAYLKMLLMLHKTSFGWLAMAHNFTRQMRYFRDQLQPWYFCFVCQIFHDDVIKWKHFRVTGPLCGEFTGPGEFPTQRPVTRSFDVFFDLRLNKRLS